MQCTPASSFRSVPVLAVLALALCSGVAWAETEGIDSFDSSIVINADSSMDVTETIAVTALGREIKHGIKRQFPLHYSNNGKIFSVGFVLTGVERDGQSEPHHEEESGDGVDIYIGSSDSYVSSGPHVYVLKYHTTYQLGHFDDHDELYWNVTGNGWDMPITAASATVTLPAVVAKDKLRVTGFTGPFGSTAQDYSWTLLSGSQLQFETSRPLGAYEGVTIVVGFPPGLVDTTAPDASHWSGGSGAIVGAPPMTEAELAAARLAKTNRTEGVALLALGLLAAFYTFLWMRVGRDPQPGNIYLQSEPPDGLSPAAMRYIVKKGSPDRALALVILSLAQRGVINIAEDAEGAYTLSVVSADTSKLAPEELEAFKALFKGDQQLAVDNKHHSRFSAAESKISGSLKAQFGKAYYRPNQDSCSLGCLGTLVAMGLCAVVFGSAGFAFASPLLFFCGIGMIALAILFAYLLPAYTRRGREALDLIEGYKLYLTGGDPGMPFARTPEQLKQFGDQLAYALALDVQSSWSRLFTTALQQAQGAAPGPAAPRDAHSMDSYYMPLRPVWYSYYGTTPFDPYLFSSRFNDHFASTLRVASVDPSSSSSSGGGFSSGGSSGFSGGSSGGGGGGGGGSGW